MISPKLTRIFYGGDYNPEQWPEAVWHEDMRLMKKAGVNLVSVGVFSWALLQSDEATYHFEWLDRLLDLLAANGIYADLATASASPPPWLSSKYPDSLPVDQNGNRISYGSRQSYCPNSPSYRVFSQKLLRKLAERYQSHPALAMWHINNEYAVHTAACYCENCARGFRAWLKKKYGTVQQLNEAWGTNFWGQHYYEWSEIIPPRTTSTFSNPGQVLDYQRFMSDSLLECCLGEYEIIKSITPDIPVTTNFVGDFKSLDYQKWAEHLDVISWDNYPEPNAKPSWAAFNHDLMRGLKNGQPFILMEQATNQVNWRPFNSNKRPGVMSLWSYQALARGADGIMFFQWRQSLKGAERFHSAIVNCSGSETTRVFREVAKLGNELAKLDELVDSKVPTEVAILFDYENWWAVEYEPPLSTALKYLEQIRNYYNPLFDLNIPVDIISVKANLSRYRLVIAPLLYLMRPGAAEKIEQYVADGGIFVTTFFSGIVDETGGIFPSGYPGPLKKVLGLSVEEFDALEPQMTNGIEMTAPVKQFDKKYACNLWCDVVHPDTAKAFAVFTSDYYAGFPAVTENDYGKGKAYYVATQPEYAFIRQFLKYLCDIRGITAPLNVPDKVEVIRRIKGDHTYLFLLNHNETIVELNLAAGKYQNLITGNQVADSLVLQPKETVILKLI